ncbi:MAG: hypothetical protein C4K49_11935 [Candidatus Thorarchaeota archaeon]|nr:MAG: hypothetical protein C4K49_11935 [Candidatus Thorarchaeota archaeon]
MAIAAMLLSLGFTGSDLSSICGLDASQKTPQDSIAEAANYTSSLEECTSVIVTGSAAKDGRAILMKNRDSSEEENIPVYHPATNTTFAFVAVNSLWMGINEKGLAVMNTAMPALSDSPYAGSYNGILNQRILQTCQDVTDVEVKLKADDSPLLPDPGSPEESVATCVGVIDSHGLGAFFEIGDLYVSVEYVADGYQSRANHPRTYPGLASGPSGRDQHALDALDAILAEKGAISWQDVAQRVSRYVREKQTGSDEFRIGGEVCNDYTVSAMVAVSGDSRYDGRLNIMWCEYGPVPMTGVFLPSMAYGGSLPSILNDMVSYTQVKRNYACDIDTGFYDSLRVRKIQNYSFAAEDYTFEQYDRLIDFIPEGLSDAQLNETLNDFIRLTVSVATDMYVNESSTRPKYAVPFVVDAIPTVPTTRTETTSATATPSITSATTKQTTSVSEIDSYVLAGTMIVAGLTSGVLLALAIRSIQISKRSLASQCALT